MAPITGFLAPTAIPTRDADRKSVVVLKATGPSMVAAMPRRSSSLHLDWLKTKPNTSAPPASGPLWAMGESPMSLEMANLHAGPRAPERQEASAPPVISAYAKRPYAPQMNEVQRAFLERVSRLSSGPLLKAPQSPLIPIEAAAERAQLAKEQMASNAELYYARMERFARSLTGDKMPKIEPVAQPPPVPASRATLSDAHARWARLSHHAMKPYQALRKSQEQQPVAEPVRNGQEEKDEETPLKAANIRAQRKAEATKRKMADADLSRELAKRAKEIEARKAAGSDEVPLPDAVKDIVPGAVVKKTRELVGAGQSLGPMALATAASDPEAGTNPTKVVAGTAILVLVIALLLSFGEKFYDLAVAAGLFV